MKYITLNTDIVQLLLTSLNKIGLVFYITVFQPFFFHNTQLRHVCDFNYHTLKTTTYDKCIAPFTTLTKKQFWVPKSEN